ncbi:acetyltransferase (GNAT) family protein [Luteimonas cucumeris]|uniref:Acetyltransferase (GNAT) family protein n=1 Tax=Luteimonas cucumeris TaxID=985012 RepID=A0A562KXB7_9GAMM|nr:GNAT family N-acetyltransferase [Luteimonas cucumeris]TWH99996.1 acetyltransferase (GNAT) family protein [Luteimonas cucumeris]
MASIEIRPLADAAALREAWPVAQQLRPHLTEESFVAQALRQLDDGFSATALYDTGVVRAYAGWRMHENLVYGRHMYVDDLVTDAGVRGRGHGKALLDWLKDEARRQGCARLMLDSGTHRKDAHAFYLREGLRIEAFHFGITL